MLIRPPREPDMNRFGATRLAICGTGMLLLAALTWAVEAGSATPVDLAVGTALTPLRTHGLIVVFLWLTLLGTEATVLGIAMATSALLWSDGRTRAMLTVISTVCGAEATTWIIKAAVGRARPEFLRDAATAISPSFPSAHTTGTVALVGILAGLVVRSPRGGRRRVAVGCVAAAIAIVIGFSRVFLSVHFLTDVLAGALVGGIWLTIGSALLDAPERRAD